MPPKDRVRRRLPRFLTVGEVNLLLRSARGTVRRDIIYVLVRTGVRAAELAALRWEDVDLERRVIRVGGRTPPRTPRAPRTTTADGGTTG